MCYNKAKACSHVMMKDGITVMKRTILASGSPRRKELLEQIGMEFIVITSEADEHTDITDPEQYVIYLSGIKAEAVHNKIQESIDDGLLKYFIHHYTFVVTEDRVRKPHVCSGTCL